MSPNHNRSQQEFLLLFIVSQCSINYFKGEHAQTQFWSNVEITKCCGYREYNVKDNKDKDKEALFNVAYSVTDNISS